MQLTAGYLHGFDKFMNLVLMNVDETYTVMVRVPHPYTVTTHEPADPQPLQPHYALNPDTGVPTLVTAAPTKQATNALQLMMSWMCATLTTAVGLCCGTTWCCALLRMLCCAAVTHS